ncbi:MAG TPA: aminotransferase class I/II-fold pyridoxal phosphate-dependent enzyme, partial [Bacillota bacterium]|nr:aminotransferase class I/II-fold pyridoxal phosphate-dependent enzyme [Bacillota bacterium]
MSVNSEHKHGGNLDWAAEIYQKDRAVLIDFSSNINPLGIPATLKDILLQNIGQMINYPDPEYKELRGYLSEYTGISANRIIPGNGSAEIIFLLFQSMKPSKVLLPAPTFSEYEKNAFYAGAEVYHLQLEEANEFELDVERLVAEIATGMDCVILCNPNNPTSTLIKRQQLEYLVKQASQLNAMVIIDEAFIELTVGSSANSMVESVAI